jgi:DNA processing protein
LADWLWLALTELHLSFTQSRKLVQQWPHIEELFYNIDLNQLRHFLSRQQLERWQRLRKIDLPTHFRQHYRWLQTHQTHLLTWHDVCFPKQLKLLHDCPGWLWVQGNIDLLADPAIAMVGGRRASPSGLALAKEYAQALASAGLTVVSGLAIGVDGASHAGALAVGGDTIAVLGSGLAKIYPARHQQLAKDIVTSGGALVSPWPLFLPAMPHQFPARNSIVSGLSLGVLVVEAAPKSGSLITAKTALEQGREVFALPASTHNRQAQGSLGLLREGACLVYTPQQIIAELAPMLSESITRPAATEQCSPTQHLSAQLQQLLNQFGSDPLPIDIICQQLALPYAEVAAQLMELTLLGYLAEGPQGYERIG